MRNIFLTSLGVLSSIAYSHAAILPRRPLTQAPKENIPTSANNSGIFDEIIYYIFLCIGIFIAYYITLKLLRFAFEIYYSKTLTYLKITVPRSDSKLDKERETKKDYKEKIGMMSIFYKAIHKLSETGLKDTILNFIFRHSKISLELVYDNGEVHFYIITYRTYVHLIVQHLTSIYNDAEIIEVSKKDYINIKPK